MEHRCSDFVQVFCHTYTHMGSQIVSSLHQITHSCEAQNQILKYIIYTFEYSILMTTFNVKQVHTFTYKLSLSLSNGLCMNISTISKFLANWPFHSNNNTFK